LKRLLIFPPEEPANGFQLASAGTLNAIKWIGRRVPSSRRRFYKRLFLATLARLRLRRMYWGLARKKEDVQLTLGYEGCRQFFDICRRYHKQILHERDYRKRAEMYADFSDTLYEILRDCAPELENFGYVPEVVHERTDLFDGKVVLDYGCGYGHSTELLSKTAQFVSGIDCSRFVIKYAQMRCKDLSNVEFRLNSSPFIPCDDESIDTVYSNDLLEHLHPDDLVTHIKEVHRILKEGGSYVFWTPGRESGPHDCTNWFYPRRMGFRARAGHLREYTSGELVATAKEAGFGKAELPDLSKNVLMIISK